MEQSKTHVSEPQMFLAHLYLHFNSSCYGYNLMTDARFMHGTVRYVSLFIELCQLQYSQVPFSFLLENSLVTGTGNLFLPCYLSLENINQLSALKKMSTFHISLQNSQYFPILVSMSYINKLFSLLTIQVPFFFYFTQLP